MRSVTVVFIFLFIHVELNAQSADKNYDSVLAKKLHADEYGMKKYHLVILKKGAAGITYKKA